MKRHCEVKAVEKTLARLLREVARCYFDGERKAFFDMGICCEVNNMAVNHDDHDIDGYLVVDELLAEMQEGWKPKEGSLLAPYPMHRAEWEPRAWMCLFMAQQLEDPMFEDTLDWQNAKGMADAIYDPL